jgi:hypothetical protein
MKKIHESWNLLNPNELEKCEHFQFDDYYERISRIVIFQHIPKLVFEQWIYPHHYNEYTIKNYAWINYENIEFELVEWTYDDFLKVHVIKAFMDYVKCRMALSDLTQFCCSQEDVKYWKINGTWKTPPIIIDLSSFGSKLPKWSDLKPPYQLVEGHSRLGYLYSMKRISELKKGIIASTHLLYLMKEKH